MRGVVVVVVMVVVVVLDVGVVVGVVVMHPKAPRPNASSASLVRPTLELHMSVKVYKAPVMAHFSDPRSPPSCASSMSLRKSTRAQSSV